MGTFRRCVEAGANLRLVLRLAEKSKSHALENVAPHASIMAIVCQPLCDSRHDGILESGLLNILGQQKSRRTSSAFLPLSSALLPLFLSSVYSFHHRFKSSHHERLILLPRPFSFSSQPFTASPCSVQYSLGSVPAMKVSRRGSGHSP